MIPPDIITRIQNIYDSCDSIEKDYLKNILLEIRDTGESYTYDNVWLSDYKEIPVDKYTFLTSEQYLGNSNNKGKAIYPAWMDVMLELEKTGNQYTEIALTGATRIGKTSTAVSDAAYQLYKLMCLKNPQEYFGLKSVTQISIFFFNITQTLAKGVAFKEFNSTLATSPWFNEHGHFTDSEVNPIYIPEGGLIEVAFGSEASHGLGKAVHTVVFDECNFAQAGIKDVNKAKERMKEKYDTLVARVTGTFVKHGEVYGRIYIISSKKSDSDFMEDYIQAQKSAGNPHLYVFDKPQWEVWPKSKYSSDKTFKLALGGKKLRSYVVPDDQMDITSLADIQKQGYVLMDVPEDNKVRFLADIDVALRDIAGISIPGTMSFINQESLDACIHNRQNPFFTDTIQIGTQDDFTIEEFFHKEVVDKQYLSMPMFIHLDLALTTDRAGISGVVASGRKDIQSEDKTVMSQLTFTHIFTVGIEAPKGDKIAYSKITAFLCWLRKQGFNISRISRDQFQSEYMAQLLEEQGFDTDKISLDRTPDGYMAGRSIILEQRVDMLNCDLLQDELIHLQRDSVTGRVDHPANGCFTGDTKIKLVDGRSLSILDLLQEQQYRINWVYTINEETLNVEPKRILSVHQTKLVNTLIKITLDNDESFTCTCDHRIMLRDGKYCQAQDIQIGQSLMPLYTQVSDKGLDGYRMYYDPGDKVWHYEHRKFVGVQLKSGYVVHHCNYDKLNNCPTNLHLISRSEHQTIHNNSTHDYSKTSISLMKYYKYIQGTDKEKIRNELCRKGTIESYIRRGNYKQPEQEKHIQEIETTFDVSWDELSSSEKSSYGTKLARMKDQSIQERISKSLSERHRAGLFKKAEEEISGRVWYTNGVDNIYIKADVQPPEGFYKGRIISKETIEKIRKSHASLSEEKRKEISKKQSLATSNKIWITDGVIDRYINKDDLIPEGFRRGRCKIAKNHKVIDIEYIHVPCRVYDLTIEDNPNFALDAGIFVHNSKDLSDSFIGSMWNAMLNNPGVPVPAKTLSSAIRAVNGADIGRNPNQFNMFPNINIINKRK